jgi:hypothetical protein
MRDAQMRWVGMGMELEIRGSGSFMISTKHGTCHSLDAREAMHHGGMPHTTDLGLANAQLAAAIRCRGMQTYAQLHVGWGD